MANILSMAQNHQIEALHTLGWSNRSIAAHLGIDRGAVNRSVKAIKAKAAISTAGFDGPTAPLLPEDQPKNGRKSECESVAAIIVAGIEKGQSADLIWRDLKHDHGFEHSYESVKRYVRKLKSSGAKDPVKRIECLPGEEAQIDFGVARTIRNPKGNLVQSNILRVTLSFSRKGYTETVPYQNTECFIRAIENAFRHFGGAPATLVIDNLKAGVKKPDWYDPEINPKFASFAKHYGVAVIPHQPYTPQHKGKVESDVGYIKSSALKGREFHSITEQNEHLRKWEKTVADLRIHGTTRKQVESHFVEMEKASLLPLPIDLFPCYQESRRKVHRDCYVEVQRAYYAVPHEYMKQEVWVRWDSKIVRIFDLKMQSVISHIRLLPGQFSECLGARGKPSHDEKGVKGSSKYWIDQLALRIGPKSSEWGIALIRNRPDTCIRVLQGLLSVAGKHQSSAEVEGACAGALAAADFTLNYIRHWLKSSGRGEVVYQQDQFEFLDNHEVIRPMSYYENFLKEQNN